MPSTLQAFKDRILGDLLPTFCNHPSRGWGCEGFKEDWKNVSEKDAADFLLALDEGLIEHQGRGQLSLLKTPKRPADPEPNLQTNGWTTIFRKCSSRRIHGASSASIVPCSKAAGGSLSGPTIDAGVGDSILSTP